jgi:hypothetical protein
MQIREAPAGAKERSIEDLLMNKIVTSLALISGLLFSACEGGTFTPDRTHPSRPQEDRYPHGSPGSEVMTGPTGAVPLLTIDFPNTKEEQPKVHTIVDTFKELHELTGPTRPAGAATQSATQPAEAHPPVSATGELRIVAQQRPADTITITRDNEANVDLWVLCSMGIGAVTLERTGEIWPALIRVHLRYTPDRPFTTLESFNAYELPGGGAPSDDRRLTLKTTTDKPTATAQIPIPGFARSPRIRIEWVDAYR